MNVLKPPPLRRGDRIAIVAPGSPPTSHTKLQRGIRYLEQLGYRVVLGKHLTSGYGYLAGPDKERAEDLNSFFSNPHVKAIFTARGGYGSHRVLPLLDYKTIKRNPKILVGYSDITALQLALFAKTGLITFSGPMVATEFGGAFGGEAEEWFWRCLTSTKPLGTVRNPNRRRLKTLRRGTTVGRIIGGNLSLVTALLGSSHFPQLDRFILFLEEIEEPPYKIDRMLNHLKLALETGGQRGFRKGVILGEFTDCLPTNTKTPSLTLNQVMRDVIGTGGTPAVTGLQYGHVRNSLTLPVGIKGRLNASEGTLQLLESALQ
jgi:muramoyltetrapeptide carboxypeptidase